MQGQTVRHGWKISEQQGTKCVFEGARWSTAPPHTRRTGKHAGPTTRRLRLFLTTPAMRYAMDFLMKHNITFSLAPGFFHDHTLPTQIHTKERINTKQEKKSNTRQFISIGFQSLGRCPFHPTAGMLPVMRQLFRCLFVKDQGRVGLRRCMWGLLDEASAQGVHPSL